MKAPIKKAAVKKVIAKKKTQIKNYVNKYYKFAV